MRGAPELLSALTAWKKTEGRKPGQRESVSKLGVSASRLSKQTPSPLQRVVEGLEGGERAGESPQNLLSSQEPSSWAGHCFWQGCICILT